MAVARQHDGDDRQQHMSLPLGQHAIDEGLRRGRQHQAAEAVEDHQHEAQRQQPAPRPDQLPHLRPRLGQLGLGAAGWCPGHGWRCAPMWCALPCSTSCWDACFAWGGPQARERRAAINERTHSRTKIRHRMLVADCTSAAILCTESIPTWMCSFTVS